MLKLCHQDVHSIATIQGDGVVENDDTRDDIKMMKGYGDEPAINSSKHPPTQIKFSDRRKSSILNNSHKIFRMSALESTVVIRFHF